MTTISSTITGALALALLPAAAFAQGATGGDETETPAEASMALEAGADATVFRSMTVEGENRVRVEFQRPPLVIDVDPRAVSGLEWIEPVAVVERHGIDLVGPFIRSSASERTPFRARPWLASLPEGPVARFRPEVTGVERWELLVANSRGETVATFAGDGKLPDELAWDGVTLDGTPAPPGLTYSHVLEAYDRAGNKRSLSGSPFSLPAYAIDAPGRLSILLPGAGADGGATASGRPAGASPLVLEAASRINDLGGSGATAAPVRVRVTARSYERANTLAASIAEELRKLLIGDPLRVQPVVSVQPDSPESGSVEISVEG